MPTKCKRHPIERGSGVCASCLRERLLALLDAGKDPPPPPPPDLPPPPRSRSPRRRISRFFSNPQVRHAAGDGGAARSGGGLRSSLLSYLFSSSVPDEKNRDPDPRVSGSLSWISALIGRHLRRRKFAGDEDPPARDRPISPAIARGISPAIARGMSPATEDSGSESDYFAAASESRRIHPPPTPSKLRPPPPPPISVAHHRFPVLMSPLMRPSPGFSGDHRHHGGIRSGAAAAALAPNRSRKLADFGRFR